jgi:putative membrane protein
MRLKWKSAIIPLLFALLGTLNACTGKGSVEAGRGDRPSSVSPADDNFMTKTEESDIAGMAMARIALSTSRNSDVRDFANMIQADGTMSLEDLTGLMKDKNVSQAVRIAADLRQDIDRMSWLTGAEFDREFINMMVAQIQRNIEQFRDESAAAIDTDVKKYVENQLPQREMHLDKARLLQSRLFNSSRNQRRPGT